MMCQVVEQERYSGDCASDGIAGVSGSLMPAIRDSIEDNAGGREDAELMGESRSRIASRCMVIAEQFR